MHTPALHVRPAPQTAPQAPQFLALIERLTHCVPHITLPAAQVALPFPALLTLAAPLPAPLAMHTPALHVRPAPQTAPQAPQFLALIERLTHCVPHITLPGAQFAGAWALA
jgi:hypothetical protein